MLGFVFVNNVRKVFKISPLFPIFYPATMSRVLAIKDYTGPDCRYLNFKSGEEIMVYFKLSREREDLWAGSVSIRQQFA